MKMVNKKVVLKKRMLKKKKWANIVTLAAQTSVN